MKHTPGPWVATESKKPIRGAVSRTVINIEGPHKMPIAICHGAISRVDAQLIAAAPEMLGALEFVACRFPLEFKTDPEAGTCKCLQFEDGDDCRHLMVFRAIAKARGES